MWKLRSDGTEDVYFYDPAGRKLGVYQIYVNGVYCFCGSTTTLWFAGENLSEADRLGSVGTYYPWGEDYGTVYNDSDTFATYYQDVETGLDYAKNRYYSSTLGRFLTPDPSKSNALTDPGQWNKYVYAGNDPVNFYDPPGLFIYTGGGAGNSGSGSQPQPPACYDAELTGDWGLCAIEQESQSLFQQAVGGRGQSPVAAALVDMANTTNLLRKEASSAVQNLGPGCTKVFSSMNLPISDNPMLLPGTSSLTVLQGLAFAASDTTYVNGFGAEGQLTLSQVGYTDPGTGLPFSPNSTVQFELGNAGAVTLGGVAVVLSQAFYNATAPYQTMTLVHELLHITFGGTEASGGDDVGIANLFGLSYNTSLTGSALVTAASNAISNWLLGDCQK